MYIAVMLTDGRTKYQKAAEAEAAVAKNSGIFIIAIGVGRHIQVDSTIAQKILVLIAYMRRILI